MKYINEEGIVFGLLSEADQGVFEEAKANGYLIEAYKMDCDDSDKYFYDWHKMECDEFFADTTYRATIPKTTIEPLTKEEFIELGVQFIMNLAVTSYNKSGICLTGESLYSFDYFAKHMMEGINYLGENIKLYKEVSK